MAVKFKDYYEVLGVARTATADEIKAAFRKLARVYHPDVAKDKKTAEAKFKEINEANEVLSDPEKRKKYDELGANWEHGGMPAGQPAGGYGGGDEGFEFGGTGFSDFFESFFGSGQGGFGGTRRRTGFPGGGRTAYRERGEDIEADLMVPLEEALHGATRKISLRRPSHDGEPEQVNTYQVKIQPGIREGQRIRLAGQGWRGTGGGEPGDIYLQVRLARHPEFTVDGADLYFDLELAPWEAVLGVSAKIPTLDGATTLKVPAGTAAGSQLRLRGLGLPVEGGGRGNLYAVVKVQTPTSVSPKEKALWEELAKHSTFNPRDLA
jgi:curved DNA-binding protein